jgi:hypothetical protein
LATAGREPPSRGAAERCRKILAAWWRTQLALHLARRRRRTHLGHPDNRPTCIAHSINPRAYLHLVTKLIMQGFRHAKLRDLLPDRLLAEHPDLYIGDRDAVPARGCVTLTRSSTPEAPSPSAPPRPRSYCPLRAPRTGATRSGSGRRRCPRHHLAASPSGLPELRKPVALRMLAIVADSVAPSVSVSGPRPSPLRGVRDGAITQEHDMQVTFSGVSTHHEHIDSAIVAVAWRRSPRDEVDGGACQLAGVQGKLSQARRGSAIEIDQAKSRRGGNLPEIGCVGIGGPPCPRVVPRLGRVIRFESSAQFVEAFLPPRI